ncbi:MAG: SpoIVB peptidase S55 domain-containing protein [Pyramidobacter sp.]|jgi:hypothetical protein
MRKTILSGAAAVLFFAVQAAAAPFVPNEPIMPLSEVRAGMKGIGKTVFQGNRVRSFPVEILDVIRKQDRPSDLILIRASGPDIEKAGGLASGMSGSPIYVNGRLIGAFSFGWDYADPKMGLVTPIEQMNRLFDYPDNVPSFPKSGQLVIQKKDNDVNQRFDELYNRYKGSAKPVSGDVLPPAPGAEAAAPQAGSAPQGGKAQGSRSSEFTLPQDIAAAAAEKPHAFLSAGGISRRAMKNLERRLGVRVVDGGADSTAAPGTKVPQMHPGDSIAALLAWGDVTLDAEGTLTALDKSGRFVAFGHSFKEWGAVAYPVAQATVHSVVNSVESPFKLASAGRIIGMITQDRPEGVAGYFGKYPPAVSVRVEVEDQDTQTHRLCRFQMIRNEYAVVTLLPDLLGGLIDRELGRQTGGTIRYDVTITGDGIPDNWTLGDVAVSDDDISTAAAGPVTMLVSRVVQNPYQSLGNFGLKVRVSASSKQRKLIIEGITLEEGEVSAGSDVNVTMRLRPWRDSIQSRTMRLHVPADTAPGNYVVTLRAGTPPEEIDADVPPVNSDSPMTFESMLREIQSEERSCEVVLELASQDDDGTAEDGELPGEARRRKIREGSMRVFRSEYQVKGSLQVPLTVTSAHRSVRKAAKTVREQK